jgi:ABC-2 type transport system permease protein
MLLPLLVKTWRDRWRGLTAWTVGLVLIGIVELYVYPSIRDSAEGMSSLVEAFPEAMQEMFRMSDYTSPAGFLNVEMFSIMVPLVFISVGASWGASATADEEEKGTADLLLTLPVSRSQIVLTKGVATLAALAAIVMVISVSLVIGAAVVDMDLPASSIWAASAMSGLLGALYAGLGFLIGALTGRRGVALGAAIALAIAGFLVYSLAPMLDLFDTINPMNPFQWAVGGDPLRNGMDAGYVLGLAGVTLVLFAGALLSFSRRDIRAE